MKPPDILAAIGSIRDDAESAQRALRVALDTTDADKRAEFTAAARVALRVVAHKATSLIEAIK